jgi:TRAP-type mannitol/chloroaromatic compound transport system substrate-binding protein
MSTRRKFIKAGSIALASQVALSACTKKPDSEVASTSKGKVKYKWKMITTWPKNFPGLGTGANKLAQYINELTDGAIEVKVFGAGEIVPALEVFDAVQRGTAEIGHGAAYYWQGKHEATSFFAAIPFGLNAHEMNSWIYYGGAQKLWDDLYAPFGVKPFCAGNTGVQMGGWFNKDLISLDTFKGLKIRMPGLGGKVISELGSVVVAMPGGEIFQALKTGTIDGAEWVGPYNDLAMGLHKAAKFYYWPGWHEPGSAIEALLNKKAYDALPKSLQLAVERACQCANLDMMADYYLKNAEALTTLTTKEKVILKKFPDEVLKKLHEISNDIVLKISRKDALSKQIFTSFEKALKVSYRWNEISEAAFTDARKL